LEEMLYVIRAQKDKYKDKFATDINEIRDQNKNLLDKNNKLAESNQALQKQLEEIKSRLWKDD
jgi:lipoate-protein ligase A